MKFYTASKLERPIRLCQSTRQFAYDSLMHVYGLDTAKTESVLMDDIVGFEQMSDLEKYDAIIRKIAQTAPIRICDGEMISGAATLGMAIYHKVPAVYKGNYIFESISHLTVDFETVLRRGINGIRDDVYNSLSRHSETRKVEFLHSCLATIDSFSLWHNRYISSLKKDDKYKKTYKIFCRCRLALHGIFMRQYKVSGLPLRFYGFAATGPASAGLIGFWAII